MLTEIADRHPKLHACTCSPGRCDGLMVSALDSGLKGVGSSPGQVIVLCSWEDTLLPQYLSPPGSTCILVMWLGNLQMDLNIPSRRSSNNIILLVILCYRYRNKLPWCGALGTCADFTFVPVSSVKMLRE